ncbi:hypothetical protein [Novosphingobium sp. FSW06-99]|uniref:hypothetical protein n=1 Tax=Novosphingobium sp. FSW06-99 TaxID=1739113 RepID=UPI00076CD0DD|nr:hypothetical protein [Novosphingobium sp. FSW06-99]KUR80935.1 hypothetical protein AQZ49_02615 [Novosphingobium sp. FSW06-99]
MNEIPPRAIHGGDQCDGSARRVADGVAGDLPNPATPTYALVRAMEDVMAVRHDQIFHYGHTPEKDARRPLRQFVEDLHTGARAIVEDVQFHKPHDRIRRRLVKLAALTLATIDRIDNEGDAL